MALNIVATSIGNDLDISERAKQLILDCDILIGEERAEVSKLLKRIRNLSHASRPIADVNSSDEIVPPTATLGPTLELLNEHTETSEVERLAQLCYKFKVVLVSDCGTPGFSDPGAQLVARCRRYNIPVSTAPGPSALTALISLTSRSLREFLFLGFLSPENDTRRTQIKNLKLEKRPLILMDTPYRMGRLLEQLSAEMPDRVALIACDISQSTERIEEATLAELNKRLVGVKAEFMLLIY
jgi:16S rRNA (cytidine1402-2'-O)-methyltransferase